MSDVRQGEKVFSFEPLSPPPAKVAETTKPPSAEIPSSTNQWAERSANVQKNFYDNLWDNNRLLRKGAENYLEGDVDDPNPCRVEMQFREIKNKAERISPVPYPNDIAESAKRIISQVTAPLLIISSCRDINLYQEIDQFTSQFQPLFEQLLGTSSADEASNLAKQILSAAQTEADHLRNRADTLAASSRSIKAITSQEHDDFEATLTAQKVNFSTLSSDHLNDLQRFKEYTHKAGTNLEETSDQSSQQLSYTTTPVSQFLDDYLHSTFPSAA